MERLKTKIEMTMECPSGHRETITEQTDVGAYPLCSICYLPMFPIKAARKFADSVTIVKEK